MDFTDRTYSFIEKHEMLRQKGSVTVGISGGADSVCLFLQLYKLRERLDISLHAVTVEHGIRGDESVHDAEYSRQLCERYGVDCTVVHVDAPSRAAEKGISLEEAARQLRYEAFFQNTKPGDYIALAHHMEDQAETVLFHMIRGSGVRGLMGMRPVTRQQDRYIVRPLLFATKEEIIAELEENGISYCTDSTNADTEYARNRIRSIIMPELTGINAGAVRHICESAESVGELYDRFFSEENDILDMALIPGEKKEDNALRIEEIRTLDDTARRLILMEYLRQTLRSIKDVSREHINRLSALIADSTHFSYDLPKGARVVLEYGIMHIIYPDARTTVRQQTLPLIPLKDEIQAYGYAFKMRLLSADELDMSRDAAGRIIFPSKNYEKWFDYDKIKNDFCLRTARDGDYFVIDAAGHTKSYRDYCRNQKIMREDRERIPLLVSDGSHIDWAVGYRISADVKVSDETRQILVIEAMQVEETDGR